MTAVRDAVEDLIIGLTPAKPHERRTTFKKASGATDWPERIGSDFDREFTVEAITMNEPLFFGKTSETDYNGQIEIIIGHTQTRDRRTGIIRRDEDLQNIKENMEKSGNFPSGVSLMRSSGWESIDIDKYWLTRMTFEIFVTLDSA